MSNFWYNLAELLHLLPAVDTVKVVDMPDQISWERIEAIAGEVASEPLLLFSDNDPELGEFPVAPPRGDKLEELDRQSLLPNEVVAQTLIDLGTAKALGKSELDKPFMVPILRPSGPQRIIASFAMIMTLLRLLPEGKRR